MRTYQGIGPEGGVADVLQPLPDGVGVVRVRGQVLVGVQVDHLVGVEQAAHPVHGVMYVHV